VSADFDFFDKAPGFLPSPSVGIGIGPLFFRNRRLGVFAHGESSWLAFVVQPQCNRRGQQRASS
jgi:hypothetical protein